MSVITAVTAQNTAGVSAVFSIPPDIIRAQADAVFQDIRVDGVKIGMLAEADAAEAVADILEKYRPQITVLDPVMVSTSGDELSRGTAIKAVIERIMPHVKLITPNIPEAERLSGIKISDVYDMARAARIIGSMGPRYVLIKGGHLPDSADDLIYNGKTMTILEGKRLNVKNTHGTGCSISSAICANLSKGMDMVTAAAEAKRYVRTGLEHGLDIGHGCGPLHHFYDLWRTSEPSVETEFDSREKE